MDWIDTGKLSCLKCRNLNEGVILLRIERCGSRQKKSGRMIKTCMHLSDRLCDTWRQRVIQTLI